MAAPPKQQHQCLQTEGRRPVDHRAQVLPLVLSKSDRAQVECKRGQQLTGVAAGGEQVPQGLVAEIDDGLLGEGQAIRLG